MAPGTTRMSENEPKIARLLGKRLATYHGIAPPPLKVIGFTAVALLVWFQLASPWLNDVWLGLVSLAGMILSAIVCGWLYHPRRVELYQHGLEYSSWGRTRRLYWNQLSEIYQQRLYRVSMARDDSYDWLFHLVSRDGSRLRLHHMEGIRDLGRRIEQQFASRHLPMVVSAFCTGYTIRFGRRLTINTDGLHDRRRFVAWQNISEIALGINDELRITCFDDDQPAFRIPCRQIANLRILDGLLEAVRTGHLEQRSKPEVSHRQTEVSDHGAHLAPVGDEVNEAHGEDWEAEEADDRDSGRPRQPR